MIPAEAKIEKVAVLLHRELRPYEDPYEKVYYGLLGQLVSALPEDFVGHVRFDGVILEQGPSKPSWDFYYRKLAEKIIDEISKRSSQ
jgi:hypothetical protein